MAKIILKKKQKVGGLSFPMETFLKGTVSETVQYWHKDRQRPVEPTYIWSIDF